MAAVIVPKDEVSLRPHDSSKKPSQLLQTAHLQSEHMDGFSALHSKQNNINVAKLSVCGRLQTDG